MKTAYIISTGSELLAGTTLDSNSVFLSQKLMDLGVKTIGKSTVGDNHDYLSRAFQLGLELADIVISSGGLGPTFDDLTKIVACELMDCGLELREDEARRIRKYFERRKIPMSEINLRQAMFPVEAIALKNKLGTAPGMYLQKNDKLIILLPGPPREMSNMYINEVEPLLKRDFGSEENRVIKKTIKILGLGEPQVEERLNDLMPIPEGLTMALLAVDGEIHIRLAAEGQDEYSNRRQLYDISQKIIEKMGNNVFACDDKTLVSKIADLLLTQGKSLAVAESCTGGIVSGMLTDLPGSSRYFWGGITSYSNAAKRLILGVKDETLNAYGAVSPETAREMAMGTRQKAGVDFALSITGIAGPDGGSNEKPVGLVYVGLAWPGGCEVKELKLGGGRELIRILSAKFALDFLRRHLEY